MANYKVIFRTEQEEIPWEPGCPIMFTAIQVSRNVETSEAYLQAKVRNVSGEKVESIRIWVKPKFANGTSNGMQVDFLDADIPAGQETVLTPSKFPRGDISSCELTIAWAASQSESWKTSGETGLAPVPAGPALELSPRALEQRKRNIAGGDAQLVSERSVQDHGGWWVCACGQVNVGRNDCCKCSYSKELLVENEDEAKLLAEADEYDAERLRKAEQLQQEGSISSLSEAIKAYKSLENGEGEDVSGRLAECDAKLAGLKKKRTRQLAVIASVFVLVAAAILVTTQVIIPGRERAALVETVASSQVGKTVEFGEYEQDNDTSNGKELITWRVLAREDDKVLLISEKVLDYREYYEKLGPTDTLTYENSDLSAWLKGEFADTAFSKGERGAIIDGPFCLSESELEDYFPSSGARICFATPYVQAQNNKHLVSYWWLSSPGAYQAYGRVFAGCVSWRGETDGYQLTSPCGVRPAIWVQL